VISVVALHAHAQPTNHTTPNLDSIHVRQVVCAIDSTSVCHALSVGSGATITMSDYLVRGLRDTHANTLSFVAASLVQRGSGSSGSGQLIPRQAVVAHTGSRSKSSAIQLEAFIRFHVQRGFAPIVYDRYVYMCVYIYIYVCVCVYAFACILPLPLQLPLPLPLPLTQIHTHSFWCDRYGLHQDVITSITATGGSAGGTGPGPGAHLPLTTAALVRAERARHRTIRTATARQAPLKRDSISWAVLAPVEDRKVRCGV